MEDTEDEDDDEVASLGAVDGVTVTAMHYVENGAEFADDEAAVDTDDSSVIEGALL